MNRPSAHVKAGYFLMNKRLLQVLAMCSALVSATASAEALSEYVDRCKADLGITTTLPWLNCSDGPLFAPNRGRPNLENDSVVYARINDVVDAVVACRWLGPNVSPPFSTAASVEMMLHNRQNGNTCFFAAQNPTGGLNGVETVIPAPDSGGFADAYWMTTSALDAKVISDTDPNARLRCVGCHASGPYIASPRIAPFLARYGLLNNGHDTLADMTAAKHYHAVGSSAWNTPTDPTNTFAFKAWDSIIVAQHNDTDNNGRPDTECSGACHSIARNTTGHSLDMAGQVLIPAQSLDIKAVENLDQNKQTIQQIMPPLTYSDYRWVNVDTPTNVATGDTGDNETLQKLQQVYPQEWSRLACKSPSFVQAHVVGSDVIYDTSPYADKLHSFNLRDGLTCLQAEQTGSHACLDYQTRYLCSSGQWTDWINSPSSAPDDHEERSGTTVSNAIQCGRGAAVAIQAKFTIPNTTNVVVIDGPPDRLTQFDKFGLKCDNAAQGTGQTCSNYVVRFVCDTTPPRSTLNADHLNSGRHNTVLTDSSTFANDGINNQTYVPDSAAQQWTLVPVTDFTNPLLWTISVNDRSRAVRIKNNQASGLYATTNDINKGPDILHPSFLLLAQIFQATWTTQIWIQEPIPVPFESGVRFRSAWVAPLNKSFTPNLYMELTNTKNNDTGTQDVFVRPSKIDHTWDTFGAIPVEFQRWVRRGVGGPIAP